MAEITTTPKYWRIHLTDADRPDYRDRAALKAWNEKQKTNSGILAEWRKANSVPERGYADSAQAWKVAGEATAALGFSVEAQEVFYMGFKL